MTVVTTRARPVVRARCTACGLLVVGELRVDGLIYPARHPETVEGVEIAMVCLPCDGNGREALGVAAAPRWRRKRSSPR